MTEMTDYKSAPAELKAAAEEIASTYDFDRAVLSGAILAALLAEREAERGRWLAAIKPHVDAITFADIQALARTPA